MPIRMTVHTVPMNRASPEMVRRRVLVGAPFIASMLIVVFGPLWGAWVVGIGLMWTVSMQILQNRHRDSFADHPGAALVAGFAFWLGPSAWVGGAVYYLSQSLLLATFVGLVLCFVGVAGWAWAFAAPRGTPAEEVAT
jgi:hypothetical protein